MAAGGRRLAGMSRRRRTPCRGGIYHVVQRGNRRQAIYETDQDRRLFLEMLADTLPRFGFRYHGYCLMGNHYHLMVETPNANLGKGMHWLNGVYAARFNATHDVDGHLFQDRYWASPVAGAKAIVEVARYIAANPLRAGLCDRAELWPWSTYPMALGITPRPSHVTLDLIMACSMPTSASTRPASASASWSSRSPLPARCSPLCCPIWPLPAEPATRCARSAPRPALTRRRSCAACVASADADRVRSDRRGRRPRRQQSDVVHRLELHHVNPARRELCH